MDDSEVAAKGKKLRSQLIKACGLFSVRPSLCIRRAAGCKRTIRYAASDHREPYSKAALLSQRLAVFSLAVAIVGILALGAALTCSRCSGSLIIACAAILSAIWLLW